MTLYGTLRVETLNKEYFKTWKYETKSLFVKMIHGLLYQLKTETEIDSKSCERKTRT